MSSRCHLHGLDCMMPDIQQSMNTATTCQKNTKVLNFQYLLLLKYLYLNGQKHEIFWLEWKLWQYKWSNVIVYCLRYFQKFRLTRHAHSFRYWPLANTRKKNPSFYPSCDIPLFAERLWCYHRNKNQAPDQTLWLSECEKLFLAKWHHNSFRSASGFMFVSIFIAFIWVQNSTGWEHYIPLILNTRSALLC